MMNLILKDFRSAKNYLGLSMLAILCLAMSFMYILHTKNWMEVELYLLFVLLSGFFIPRLFVAMDEKNNSQQIWTSLPVSRTQIVIARYSASLLLVLLLLGLQYAVSDISVWVFDSGKIPIIHYPVTWVIIAGLLLFSDLLFYPLYFWLGLAKGATLSFIFKLSILISGIYYFSRFSPEGQFEQLHSFITDLQPVVIAGGIIAVILTLYTCSMALSIRFYKKKEL